jgi:LPS export ABC transporter protein LptC
MNRARLLLVLLGLAILGIAFGLGRGGRTLRMPVVAKNSEAQSLPYVAEGVVVRQTGADGLLTYELHAERVVQQAVDRSIAASNLSMRYEPRDARGMPLPDRSWTLAAARALLPEDSSSLKLRGDVVATGKPPGNSQLVTLRTQSLDYSTQTQDLQTRDAVQFQWGRQLLEGRGLNANIKLGRIELESEVHGRIAP